MRPVEYWVSEGLEAYKEFRGTQFNDVHVIEYSAYLEALKSNPAQAPDYPFVALSDFEEVQAALHSAEAEVKSLQAKLHLAEQDRDSWKSAHQTCQHAANDLGDKLAAVEAHANELEKLRREEQLMRNEAQDKLKAAEADLLNERARELKHRLENKRLREALENQVVNDECSTCTHNDELSREALK